MCVQFLVGRSSGLSLVPSLWVSLLCSSFFLTVKHFVGILSPRLFQRTNTTSTKLTVFFLVNNAEARIHHQNDQRRRTTTTRRTKHNGMEYEATICLGHCAQNLVRLFAFWIHVDFVGSLDRWQPSSCFHHHDDDSSQTETSVPSIVAGHVRL